MQAGNFTKLGLVALGEVVRQALLEQQPEWQQSTLVERLAATGHKTNKDRVSRLITAGTTTVDAALVLAIARLEICRNPATGEPYSNDDLLDIACELIDPKTGLRKNRFNGVAKD